ncbi:MAG TPA: ATP-binding cassette domain-containing protein [Solirubrobacteraceae bacterium]|jgi:putative ABC transport system ATP-binding protein
MAPLLSLHGVGKSYLRGSHRLRVLHDVSLEVCRGEVVAVWGRRGAGKTTLLKIAARLEAPDYGSVRFDGTDLATVRESEHARLMLQEIGWVRRSGPRSDLRMIDYVALPCLARHGRRRAGTLAAEALERVGMGACAVQRWESLSDGERSLAAIAHGIVRAPKLLLVDDPTANLDAIERERTTELLRSLAEEQGIAILMTVPDMPAVMRAHHIASLGGGRLSTAPAPASERGNVIALPSREQFA